MTSIKDNFYFLSFSNTIPAVNIVDGIFFTICGKVIVHGTTSLFLDDVLWVPTFSVSLLFISKLTTQIIVIIFILPIVCFRICRLG